MPRILERCIDCRERNGTYGQKLICTAGLGSRFEELFEFEEFGIKTFEKKLFCSWLCSDCAPLWIKMIKHLNKVGIFLCELSVADKRWMHYDEIDRKNNKMDIVTRIT